MAGLMTLARSSATLNRLTIYFHWRFKMKKVAITLLFVFALTLIAGAQKKTKPWTEWSEKEVAKMLNDSAWGQTQTETNTSEMFYSPTAQGGGVGSTNTGGITGSNDRTAQGALNQATSVSFRIRLLSAK